ncbi:activator-dependent family glycosyltransferase [Streptosporangium oxazolinicum]|uniref:activator-dependent family glycosyltransferase n=1 Tax=Streptosporangium oxazolinicum TaxID=909287 RepID=UPI003CD09952
MRQTRGAEPPATPAFANLYIVGLERSVRVLFTTFAASTHLYNMVPLAWALRAAGHEVCVASRPNIQADILAAGLTAVSVGDEIDMVNDAKMLEQLPDDGTPYRMGYDIAELRPEKLTLEYVRDTLGLYSSFISEYQANQAMLDDLVRFARSWKPDLVIWDALTYVGPVAARVTGAAHARMLFGMDHFARMRELFHRLRAQNPDGPQNDPMGDWLAGRLAPFGHEFGEEMVTGQLTIDPLPSWMRISGDLPVLPVRFVPYNGPSTIPDWLAEPPRAPRVCLTFGVTARNVGLHHMRIDELLQAVAGLDVEVIATLNAEQLESVSSVPDNVHVHDFVPLNALLPSCSAVVHHLGASTMGTAIVHGVPQLLVPGNLWGEPQMARLLEEHGAALFIAPEELSPETLTSNLARLLDDPSFTEGAAQIQKEMLTRPSPGDVVSTLEQLVVRHATTGG